MNTNLLNIKIKKFLGSNTKKNIISLLFWQRNKFLLFNITNRAKKNKVNVNYWMESDNLGDTISPLIVNYMLEEMNISPDKNVKSTKHLYAVGSVLTAGIQDCTVWGSGILNATLTYRLLKRKLDIRSVRGPVTRGILIDYGFNVPEVFGDPAILMPEIYQPNLIEKKYKFGLVMHMDYNYKNEISDMILDINIMTSDYKGFLDKLCSVDIVIASSLHGIILAEAYGVKAILLKPKKDFVKYLDWYFSTGRLNFPIADSIDEAMQLTPPELPMLSDMIKSVKLAFPYDIYE